MWERDQLTSDEIDTRIRRGIGYWLNDDKRQILIEEILVQTSFREQQFNILSKEKYLNKLIAYLNTTQNASFNRYTWYDHLFNELFADLTLEQQQSVEKVAFAFELMHSIRLEKKEFEKLCNKIQIETNLFLEKGLGQLARENDEEYYEWTHHTFSEYLTARYLIRLPNLVSNIEKYVLVKEEDFFWFKLSWLGVLRFTLESTKSSEVSEWLLNTLEAHKDALIEPLAELITIAPLQANKHRIFNLVYTIYYKKLLWLPIWARREIYQLIDAATVKKITSDYEKKEPEIQRYIHRSNIISIISSLIEYNSDLLNSEDKQKWKERIIQDANDSNPNGVLQRTSLHALVHWHDTSLITENKIKNYLKGEHATTDSLLRDAYIQFLYETDANNSEIIKQIVYAFTHTNSIYPRFGLNEVTSKEGILQILQALTDDESFRKKYISHDRIYSKIDRDDWKKRLVDNIDGIAHEQEILSEVKKAIKILILTDSNFHTTDTYLFEGLLNITVKHDRDYVNEFIRQFIDEPATSKMRIRYAMQKALAQIITAENVHTIYNLLYELLPEPDQVKYFISGTLSQIPKSEPYQIALEYGWIQPPSTDTLQSTEIKKDYTEFQKLLGTGESKLYYTDVFETFLHFKDAIQARWTPDEKNRLIQLATDEVLKHSPRKFKVKLYDKGKREGAFEITNIVSYYAEAIKIIQLLAPDLLNKYRQNIIDLIPYSFTDEMQLITEIIRNPNDSELEWVHNTFLDKNDDRRYHNPQAYLYCMKQFKTNGNTLTRPKEILQSFIGDEYIPDYVQRDACETLLYFLDPNNVEDKAWLTNLSKTNPICKLEANELLISVYHDKNAIAWRLQEIVSRAKKYSRPPTGIVHSVSEFEDELMSLSFAKPIIELGQKQYLNLVLNLLAKAKELLEEDSEGYWEYANYIWRIVLGYIKGLTIYRSYDPIVELQNWYNQNSTAPKHNWLLPRIEELFDTYAMEIPKENIESVAQTVLSTEGA